MSRVWEVPVHDSTRVRDASRAVRQACGQAGLGPERTGAGELVATELATNLLRHAGGGTLVVNLVPSPSGEATSVRLFTLDHGPGIADVAAALRDGCTTAESSLGAGLGSCLRNADAFRLYGAPGRGTVATARIDPESERGGRALDGPSAGGIVLSLAGAETSGDAWGCVHHGGLVSLLLADGLGHGPKAAHASSAAVAELRRAAHLPPPEILRRLHTALRPTRGAAVAVAQVDAEKGELAFSGVGNIGARLRASDAADGWKSLVSHPGIVGAYFPAHVPLRRVPWHRDSLLVVHSDGLPSRWTPPTDPRLLAHDPSVLAATVLRDAGSPARPPRDDISVAVLVPDRRP
ncbi:SpoIIE family protein phosphatase [Streptomyces sp. NPDC048106]|uniref:SpoIIE family protein phosphatase n=1 Tax=Streptomyces sp. NPDC048106 TaxID=3155750 RepID=UPI003456D018